MKRAHTIVLIWFAWVIIVLGFQAWATARIDPKYPDRAQEWTTEFTEKGYQEGHVYLLEPFMNNQVAWDSEYYLSIALGGYDDPRAPHLTPQGVITNPEGIQAAGVDTNSVVSSNYAFFPFYPFLIRLFTFPLGILGLTPIATATLAGVLISALGTLAGMFALYDLTRESLGEEGARRAVFYLIIFPTGFFFMQVYTEGLFVGLSFGCLAVLKRKRWLIAALLAIAATMTRAVGVVLVIPMLLEWLRTGEWTDFDLEWRQLFHEKFATRSLAHGLLMFSPVITFLIWRASPMGAKFQYIEDANYGRGVLQIQDALFLWTSAFQTMISGTNPQHTAYYLTEFLGLAIGVIACIATIRTHPEIGWFSLAVVLISWGSGPAQGIHRYILGAPAVFITLARWGQNPVFDRTWTILSILLMGVLAMLFAFDMWVA